MRHSDRLRLRALYLVIVVGSGCIAPAYPDDFEELSLPSQQAPDAGSTFVGMDAGASTLPSAEDASVPVEEPDELDAGAVTGGSRDAGAAPRADAGLRVDAGSSARDAGAAEDAGSVVVTGEGPASCSLAASTNADDASRYRGKYGCAVWIANSSNKLVKAFFVATRISSRSGLPTYRTAASGVTVDVTAGATVNAAKQHQYTWMLTDSKGAKVPAGKYTFNVETHSENGVNLVSIPFDTASAPVSATGSPKGDVRSASVMCN